MKFAQDQAAGYVIRSYQPGQLQINNQSFHKNLLVAAYQLLEDWGPNTIEDLSTEHIALLVEYHPELILLGTGIKQVFPSPQLLVPLMEAGIGYEIMDTAAACRTYNLLRAEERHVVAALIL